MKHLRLLSALALVILAGCAQPLTPAPTSRASLTVTATPPQRALVPTGFSAGSITSYDLTLSSPGQTSFVQTGSASPTFTLPLLVGGTWTAQIDAKIGGTRVASGSASKTLGPGDSATLNVGLVYSTNGIGGVSLTIDAAAGPSVAAATWLFTDPSGNPTTPSGTATFSGLNQTITYTLTGMTTGNWTLNVQLFSDAQKTLLVANLHETLVVLNGYTVYPAVVMAAGAFNTSNQPQMISIPGDTFTYGGQQATVSSFLIGKYDVTQAQFQAVMGFNPSYYDNITYANPEATWSPVERVTMWDAMEYCNRLSRAEGLVPVYTMTGVLMSGNSITGATVATDFSRNGYRLPTDAEWEYAARGGNSTNDPFGGGAGATYSWTSENSSSRTHGVGQLAPNDFGLYDTFGNVFQLTTDWKTSIPPGPLFDYAGPAGYVIDQYAKVIRGGSHLNALGSGHYVFSTRSQAPLSLKDMGFRIARRAPPVGTQTLAASGLYDGVGELRYVQAATDAMGGWIVSGGTGLYTGVADTGTRRLLLSRILPSGAQDLSFGGSGTIRPADVYAQGPAAGFSQDPGTHKITLQGPWYDAAYTQYGPATDYSTRYNILYQYDPTGAPAVSANFPANGGVQEYHFFTDTDDGFDNAWQYYRNNFPVRDSLGNLYSVGHRAEQGDNTGLQKLHPDGTVENYFWTANTSGTNFVPQTLGIFANAGSQLNKILVGGLYPTVSSVLVRLNTDGTEDPSFGSSGRVTFVDGVLSTINGIRVDGQDRIYVVGILHPIGGQVGTQGVVARLLANGSLDSGFGTGGFFVLPHPFDIPRDLAIDNGGRVVVVGETKYDHSTPGFALRVLANGTGMDPSFAGGDGFQLLTKGYGGSARSVAIDNRGRVGVAGFVNNPGFIPQALGAWVTSGSSDTTPAFWTF